MIMMTDSSGASPNKKMRTTREREDLWKAPRQELVDTVIKQQQEIDSLCTRQANDSSLDDLRETVERLKNQVAESARQESMLVIRLADKEQEVQDLLMQLHELKQSQTPSSTQLQSMLLDPAINLLFVQMKREIEVGRTQLEQSQNDLAAWKFTPDSQTGKRLMAKCRMLLQENEELGRTVSSGRLAKLEGDIALHKKLILEMKNSEKDTEDFLGDADEDLEAMQSTVYLLQQELKDAKARINKQLLEMDELRASAFSSLPPNGSEPYSSLKQPHQSNSHGDFLVWTDERDLGNSKALPLIDNSVEEEHEKTVGSATSARGIPSVADAVSKHSSDGMDIEADSTTGVNSASCRNHNHSDHNRTRTHLDRLGGSASEDSSGKKSSSSDRSRTASIKTRLEPLEGLHNGVVVVHAGKVVD